MTHHILVVDDEPDIESLFLQQFRREIRNGEYAFSFAQNGESALMQISEAAADDTDKGRAAQIDTAQIDTAQIGTAQIDMVLTDINMPVMDGFTLLSHLNALEQVPKTVIVSAYGDMASIRRAMNAGAFDFITKPIQRKDLTLTIEKTLRAVDKERASQRQLEQAKLQLVQSEKMSALGQMVAGVAHEINNPINFIYGNIKPAKDYTQEMQRLIELYQKHYPEPVEDIQDLLEDIDLVFLSEDLNNLFNSLSLGAKRIRELVLSLRNFSRLDEAAQKEVDIHEGIESTLLILSSRLQSSHLSSGVAIERAYSKLPLIECYPSPLNQVIMNLLANAIDALAAHSESREQQGLPPVEKKIRIMTETIAEDWIRIAVSDNGGGIEAEAIAQLFNPFFTTKPVGKGTGLGLSISYQIIVEKHKGKLYCSSTPDGGADFFIELPVRQKAACA